MIARLRLLSGSQVDGIRILQKWSSARLCHIRKGLHNCRQRVAIEFLALS